MVSVRQYRHRSLAYFSPNFTVSNDFVHANKVPLAWLPGTTPAITGLSPIGRHRLADGEAFGTLNFMSYIHPFKARTIASVLITKLVYLIFDSIFSLCKAKFESIAPLRLKILTQ